MKPTPISDHASATFIQRFSLSTAAAPSYFYFYSEVTSVPQILAVVCETQVLRPSTASSRTELQESRFAVLWKQAGSEIDRYRCALSIQYMPK